MPDLIVDLSHVRRKDKVLEALLLFDVGQSLILDHLGKVVHHIGDAYLYHVLPIFFDQVHARGAGPRGVLQNDLVLRPRAQALNTSTCLQLGEDRLNDLHRFLLLGDKVLLCFVALHDNDEELENNSEI